MLVVIFVTTISTIAMLYTLPDRVPQIHPTSYLAPSADIIGSVIIGEQASVWFNAVLRGDNDSIHVGAHSNIQDNAVLHVDPGVPVIVGDHVTVGHSVMMHGCRIGDYSLIGIGSRILNNAVIGEYSIVGANTLITEGKTFPPRSLILGSPGKVVRPLTDQEVKDLPTFADVYVKKIERYKNLTPL